jgi:hypothetical protein
MVYLFLLFLFGQLFYWQGWVVIYPRFLLAAKAARSCVPSAHNPRHARMILAAELGARGVAS